MQKFSAIVVSLEQKGKFKVQGGLNFEPETWSLGGFAP